jgi:CRISPR-associated endoribonuclease Cas6
MTDDNDLLSLVLVLRPLTEDVTGPSWWGRAAHALLLDAIRAADPALAAELHEGQGPRPFTASTLMGRFPGGRVDPRGLYTLRLTAIEDRLVRRLAQAAAPGGPLAPGAAVVLDYHRFAVESAAADPSAHPWAASDGYAGLAAARLVATEPASRQVTLLFTSPTCFRSQERHVPVPLPDLVFGSLLERWNAFSPVAFPGETKRYADECLAISRYELATRHVPAKQGGLRVGAVGQITYTTLNYDRYWMSVLGALASFAIFSGVGAGTSTGLGQARVVENGTQIHADERR